MFSLNKGINSSSRSCPENNIEGFKYKIKTIFNICFFFYKYIYNLSPNSIIRIYNTRIINVKFKTKYKKIYVYQIKYTRYQGSWVRVHQSCPIVLHRCNSFEDETCIKSLFLYYCIFQNFQRILSTIVSTNLHRLSFRNWGSRFKIFKLSGFVPRSANRYRPTDYG